MVTCTLDVKEPEGIVFCFGDHHEASVPVIHHTFNAVYGIDLYNTDFHFIFDNALKSGLAELYKDTPKCLLAYMVATSNLNLERQQELKRKW